MPDAARGFGERACAGGQLGLCHATTLIPQAMAPRRPSETLRGVKRQWPVDSG